MPDGSSLLGRVLLFKALPAEALSELAGHLRSRRYGKGDTVFYEGDPGTSLCIIDEGRVKLALTSSEGREIIVDLLGPGDVFGELALLDGEPRSADAVAIEPTRLYLLHRDEFVRFLLERPGVAVELLGVLSRRMRRDTQLLQDAAYQDVPDRLARTLLRLAETPHGTEPAATPRLTQSDLAGLVGTTRETLNKWLGIYQDEGLIRLSKGQVFVLAPDKLRSRIS
jgi:CRP/FNR family cyclic AMP-dependent transcriptional regulator